jgi:uncharacterized protein YjbJ (UPF0337 family)
MKDKLEGKIEETKGKVTGDRVEEAKGKGRQVVGEGKRLTRDARDEVSPDQEESGSNEAEKP